MSATVERWRPVLVGRDAEPATAFVRATAARLVAAALAGSERIDDPSLADGALGKALLCHEASAAGLAPEAGDAARTYLEQCLATVRMRPCPLGLHGGSTGLLWFLAHRSADDPGPMHRDAGVERIRAAARRAPLRRR